MILEGLIAATYTPMSPDGSVNPDMIQPMFDFMCESGVRGFYVCGSTGEGPSMTIDERKLVAEQSVKAADGRSPVVVQVGSNSIAEAKGLAEHAAAVGADAFSAVPPLYFKPADAHALAGSIAEIAGVAPHLPFYYYHIPRLSGVSIDMLEFLKIARERIPNLHGIKFSDTDLAELRLCQEFENGRYDILFGCDEMLLGALAMGAKRAVGSSYCFAAPIWNDLLSSFGGGDLEAALGHQTTATQLVQFLNSNPGPYHAVVKQVVLPELGFQVGPLRRPQTTLNDQEVQVALQAFRESPFYALIRK